MFAPGLGEEPSLRVLAASGPRCRPKTEGKPIRLGIPQVAIDVRHDPDIPLLHLADRFPETRFRRKVVGIMVVERNFVPAIPVNADRHTQSSGKGLGDKVRVKGKKRDDLQTAIALLKEAELDIPLQFNNFRD